MIFIKFIMKKGKDIVVNEDKANMIFNSPESIIRITDEHGKWTGDTINKSFIVQTERDFDKEEDWSRKNLVRLPEGKITITKEKQDKINQLKKEIANKVKQWNTEI